MKKSSEQFTKYLIMLFASVEFKHKLFTAYPQITDDLFADILSIEGLNKTIIDPEYYYLYEKLCKEYLGKPDNFGDLKVWGNDYIKTVNAVNESIEKTKESNAF